jgi:hypothetical protein
MAQNGVLRAARRRWRGTQLPPAAHSAAENPGMGGIRCVHEGACGWRLLD